jgi:hypothetical protein
VVVVASILYLVWGGVAGKQRGLVVTNLRSDAVVLSFDDGHSATFGPNASKTMIAVKANFPLTMHVTDANGALLFEQRVEYKSLVDAEFRIAIGDNAILFPQRPKTG